MVAAKPGKLSSDAEEFIQKNSIKMPPEEIAKEIGKSKETVKRYIIKKELPKYGDNYDARVIWKIKDELHNQSFWAAIKDNYTKEEVAIFEDKWAAIIQQFQEDVTETERLQIHKYLTLFLLRERAVRKQTLFQRTLENITKTLEDERRKIPDEQSRPLIDKLATTIQSLTSEAKNITKEISDLSKEEREIEKSLKGTREQRIKLVQDATKNWSSIMQLLESPKIRRELGLHLEIHRAAADKARAQIAAPHQFLNKEVDLPLLNSNTVDALDLDDY